MDPVIPVNRNTLNENIPGVSNMDIDFYKAVTSGNMKKFGEILKRKPDILQQVTPVKNTAMHITAELGHLEMCKSIHAECAELLPKANLVGDTIFHKAARSRRYLIIRHFIEYPGRDSVDLPYTAAEIRVIELINSTMAMENDEKDTVMHEAVRSCHLDTVKLLIGRYPLLLGVLNHGGESPLYIAVKKKNSGIVGAILNSGQQYSYTGPKGETALHLSIKRRTPAITSLILKRMPQLIREEDKSKRTPLLVASALGLLEDVDTMLKHDTSATCHLDKDGYAAIHHSIKHDHLDVLKKFISFQPDLKDLVDERGQNILHLGVKYQKVAIINYILRERDFEGLLNGKDKFGNTPLHQAIITGNPYIVNILVNDSRIDVMLCNREGFTSLEIARSQVDESEEYDQRGRALVLATLLHAEGQNPGSIVHQISRYRKLRMNQHRSMESYKNRANTLLIVATLVATVTFAAGFTMPGGYRSEGPNIGTAVLQKHALFEKFLIYNAVGMYFSIGAVFALIWVQLVRNAQTAHRIAIFAELLTYIALTKMAVGFMTAVNMTISEKRKLETVNSFLGYFLHIVILIAFLVAMVQFEFLFILRSRRSVYVLSWIRRW